MHTDHQLDSAFKRQVVFRISVDDWPLLQAAVQEHRSIQAAILAGLQALAEQRGASADQPAEPAPAGAEPDAVVQPDDQAAGSADPDEEIRAREAAEVLGLARGTVAGYIRTGRLPGRYDASPTWLGWLTTRGAVEAYKRKRKGG